MSTLNLQPIIPQPPKTNNFKELNNWKQYSLSDKTAKAIITGGITGAIGTFITFPTEFVKTKLQLDERSLQPQYKGSFDCIKQTIRSHGTFGLFRGLSILFYGSIPKSALRFGTFEYLKTVTADQNGILSPQMRFACGFCAGIAEAVLFVTPMETIKIKFIHDQSSKKPKFKGYLHGIAEIIKAEGIAGIYQGAFATIIKQGSNQAIRFFVMETLKDLYSKNNSEVKISKPMIGIMGVFAGAASVYANTPIDVIKTRMQSLEAKKYRGFADCAFQIWKNEGFTAFYKGTVPRLSRVCLDVAITFMIYDSIIEVINNYY